MPTYHYSCTACEVVREDVASMRDFKEHEPACEKCGAVCRYVYVPTVPQVAFKDGPSGSWPSKGERIKKQRAVASEQAGKRQVERYGKNPNQLVPNFQGKETGTWAEAQYQAERERGKESAATYAGKVTEEKAAVSSKP